MKRSSGGGAGAKVPGLGSRREPGAAAPVLPELRLYRCAHVLRKGGGGRCPHLGVRERLPPPHSSQGLLRKFGDWWLVSQSPWRMLWTQRVRSGLISVEAGGLSRWSLNVLHGELVQGQALAAVPRQPMPADN